MSLTTPPLGGILAGRETGAVGVLIGSAVGVGIGIVGFRLVLAITRRAAVPSRPGEEATKPGAMFSNLWVVMVNLWICVSCFLAIIITQLLIHHVAL